MTPDSPTQMLEHEHLVIAEVVGTAPVLADRLEAGQLVDVETPSRFFGSAKAIHRTLIRAKVTW